MAKGRVKEKKNIGIFQYGWVGGVMGSFSNIKIFKVRMVRTTQDGNGMARTV